MNCLIAVNNLRSNKNTDNFVTEINIKIGKKYEKKMNDGRIIETIDKRSIKVKILKSIHMFINI